MFIPLTQDFSYWDKDKKNLIIEDFVWMNKKAFRCLLWVTLEKRVSFR